MKRIGRTFALAALLLASIHASAACRASSPRRAYPAAARADVVDEYHGERVADPYRWLEEPDAPATRAWIEGENELTFAFLAVIPARGALHKAPTAVWAFRHSA